MTRVMVTGSSGNHDYLALARKGNLVLSFKPNVISPSEQFNVAGLTYFGARLRSAPVGNAFKESDAEQKLALFGQFKAGDKWGGIDWDKQNEERASTQVGVFLRGSFMIDPEKVLDAFIGGDTIKKFAEFLISQAGNDVTLVADKDEIEAFLEEIYAPQLKKIVAKIAKTKAVQESFEKEVAGSIGVFANHTSLLKKMFNKHKTAGESEITDAEMQSAGSHGYGESDKDGDDGEIPGDD